ncbi:MAG TPA: phosphate ABC transporter substrate-binding/OmpA family protein [Xanthomonadales bacterium]|nr:phosphate ABC transporter substrate-binding/OmpA family protein [Xanthomonadales bacterium]
MNGQPKPGFYFVVLLVILSLVGYGLYRLKTPSGSDTPPVVVDAGDQTDQPAGDTTPPATEAGAEAADAAGITTVKEYAYVPSQKLPDVKGVSNYKAMDDRTVRFAINVWAGWAPIVHANGGFRPGKVWQAPGGQPFKVELVLIDDPVAMRDAYAAGDVQVGWATVDMLPLLLESLQKDSRVMPRIYQQIDWSNGGDGIVVRSGIKTASDLRGKTVVLAQNSPSHFFALNTLINSGVEPAEVDFRFTNTAFEAAAAFNADKKVAGVVSWAPDIYNLSDVKGNKLLVSTATANKLIADVWFARADFAKDHPDIMEGLVRGIFDSMVALEAQEAKQQVATLMAEGFSLPAPDALAMLPDAHWTNYAENREFFLNRNNPTNFERTFNTAYVMYRKIGAVSSRVAFDQLVDFSVLQKLNSEPKYANQKSSYGINFAPMSASAIQSESPEILTKTVVIHFFPNSWDLYKKVVKDQNGKAVEEQYDPNVDFVLEEIGKLAGSYGAARIVIEGHTDGSMRGQVPDSAVRELSSNRANSVKQELLRKFPTMDPNQFSAQGMGWARPGDASDPENHAKNRRVEVKVYPLEAQ